MPTNRLAREKSPYLLQHAHNPVDWYPWGEEAFAKARAEDKPIFLSIGYSTCHWCHVMERESFEEESIARVLNNLFIPVKVDREERPDIDRIYMLFVQASTGGGGWPMSVWLTPDLKPFYGGTYFPPENRYGRPGFRTILEHLADAWFKDRAKIEESGASVTGELARYSALSGTSPVSPEVLETGFQYFRRSFDPREGGFNGAPKFPRPVVHNFLLRYARQTGNPEPLAMVAKTLHTMSLGGMNDQLGGGYHRYSVDARWFVPHFEKMLYDQAQLAVSFLEAYQFSGDTAFTVEARRIFDYVLRDMTHSGGAFYSAEDADSVVDPAHPHHKSEGFFYIWSQEEIDEALPQPTAAWFSYHYGILEDGNVEEDPHHEFTGRNILAVDKSIAETAAFFEVPEEDVRAALAEARETLLALRANRVRPHLDDKILTAWNGLMISAFAKGAQILDEPRYAEAARRAADFVIANLWDGQTLLRRYRDGEAAIPGFLDDYAFFGLALLDLYETTFEAADLALAARLAERLLELFEDPAAGGYFATAAGGADLILRLKEDYDGAEPSGNSMATLFLLRIAAMLDRPEWRASAERTLAAFADRMLKQTPAVPQMLCAYLWAENPTRQVVLAGDLAPDLLAAVRRPFAPYQVVLRASPELPHTAAMAPVEGRPTAYVCQNFTCDLPVTTPDALASQLQ